MQQLEEYDQVRIPRHLLSDQESKDEHESRDLRRKEASAHGESDCRQNPSNFWAALFCYLDGSPPRTVSSFNFLLS